MSTQLTKEIIKHILTQFGVWNGLEYSSLNSKKFLLEQCLSFKNEEGLEFTNSIWGCSINIQNLQMKILLGDCSQGTEKEYVLIIHINNLPTYGLFYSTDPSCEQNAIAFLVNNEWNICSVGIQATFLAGMEFLQNPLNFERCVDYDDVYQLMISFIRYHDHIYGDL